MTRRPFAACRAFICASLEVSSEAGIAEDVLDKRIVEGLEQLGIIVAWEHD